MVQQQEETRKGPWTEQEDFQLVCFVGLFGDRRWDFIAKVSGLNRTGKSCRLRWVNYLHPGLKRGKMTPQEERLVLELHAKWGNRWSRIARKIPGRTDNEIKNYWRTHTRKKAQEEKRSPAGAASDTSSSSSSSSSASNVTTAEALPFPDSTTGVESFYDTGGQQNDDKKPVVPPPAPEYSMDDIWKEISLGPATAAAVEAPMCDDDQLFYCSDSLWKMDDDEASDKSFGNGQFLSGFDYYGVSEALTG